MPAAKKKAPIELQLDEANTDNPFPYQKEGATMNASIPEIAVNFDITAYLTYIDRVARVVPHIL
ncbi:hypothetical protein [Leucobacter sp. W1038]|uniref:hypothetical protein n=1 Tax=Leucobacter sp. W1038 TaxID=3438281 RepID=UPI003D973799